MLPSEGVLDPIVFLPDIIEYPVRRALYDDYGFDRSLVERPDEASARVV